MKTGGFEVRTRSGFFGISEEEAKRLKETSKQECGMRIVLGVVAMGLLLVESGGIARPARSAETIAPATVPASTAKARIDFDTQLKPIFKSKCMPCHFSGGKMYDSLPFDKPETIRKLGARLFTRIKEENERRLIDDFLNQAP